MRMLLSGLLFVSLFSCGAPARDATSSRAPLLYVWTGPHGTDQKNASNDFLAVIDADPSSARYGAVLATGDAGVPGAMAHHSEFVLPEGRPLFASDYEAGKVFLFDLSNARAPRVIRRIDSIPGFRQPHSFVRLPNGNVLATLQYGNGKLAGDPGGLAEFDPTGRLLRTSSGADSSFRGARIRTYSIASLPAVDRIVTTSTPMDKERTADVIQVWRLSDLRLLKTLAVPPAPGDSVEFYPFEVRALADGKRAILNTYYCGFYLISGLESDDPRLELVHSMRQPIRIGCSVPVIVGHLMVVPIAYDHSVVVLNVADPSHPIEVSRLASDSTVLPHWASADLMGSRIAISGQDDGEARVLIARLDSMTGRLSWDAQFRDSASTRLGLGFTQTVWPHGRTGHVMPHGVLFGSAPR